MFLFIIGIYMLFFKPQRNAAILLIVLFICSISFGASISASVTTRNLTDDNSVYSGNDNASGKIGGYGRQAVPAYDWEVMFQPDLSTVPFDAIIDSVIIGVTVDSDDDPGNTAMLVYIQNKGTFSTSANYNTLTLSAWDSLATSKIFLGTGSTTFPSSAMLVAWTQEIVDGNRTNNGLILTNTTSTWDRYQMVSGISFTVYYHSPYTFADGGHDLYELANSGTNTPPTTLVQSGEAAITDSSTITASDDTRESIIGNAGQVTIHRFKMVITDTVANLDSFKVVWEGYAGGTNDYGAKVFLWNYNSSAWDSIGHNSNTSADAVITKTITSNLSYYIQDSLNLIVTMVRSGGQSSYLYTDYISWRMYQITNNTPTDIALSPTSIAENNTNGDLIGTLTTTDADAGDSHTYSLVSGSGDGDNTAVTISNDSLFSNAVYDYESKSTYNIRIQTDDGNSGTYAEAMSFSISDGNDTPTDIVLSSSSIYEGLSTGTFIGKFTTTDQDAGDGHTYTFASGGTDNASFTISNDSLFSNAIYDYDVKNSYSIKIRTTDNGTGSLWYEETMGVTILEVENVADFTSSMNIYINTTATGTNTSSDLYNMPLLIRLDPSNFSDFANTNAGGADVRFIKSNNTFLDYEIEFWKDGASDNDTAALWVKIDTVFGDNSEQYITMIYNKAAETTTENAENVFETTNDFAAVYHLDEEQASTGTADVYVDATANNNDADDYTSATGQDAVIKEGQEFDGTDDYLSVPQSSSLDITGDVTMSGWFKLDANFTSASTASEILLTKHKNNDNNMSIALVGTDYDLPLVSDGALAFKVECRDKYSGAYKFVWTNTTSWTAGSWYYFTVVIDADNSANNKIYINGVDDTN